MPTALTSSASGSQTIRLGDRGPDVSGRTLGREVRDEVTEGVAEVIFDCSGVESMSPSFADEVFGKLATQQPRPGRLTVANANPQVLDVVRFAVNERRSP